MKGECQQTSELLHTTSSPMLTLGKFQQVSRALFPAIFARPTSSQWQNRSRTVDIYVISIALVDSFHSFSLSSFASRTKPRASHLCLFFFSFLFFGYSFTYSRSSQTLTVFFFLLKFRLSVLFLLFFFSFILFPFFFFCNSHGILLIGLRVSLIHCRHLSFIIFRISAQFSDYFFFAHCSPLLFLFLSNSLTHCLFFSSLHSHYYITQFSMTQGQK